MIRLDQRLTAFKTHRRLPQGLLTIGQDYGALIALIVLILFNLIFTRQFNSVIAITDLLVHVTPTLILGVGMTLVIATGGIDISVGSIMALTGILTYLIFSGKLFGISNIVLGTGGRATILGTVIGAIFIQLIRQTVVSLNVPDDIASIIIGLLIVLAVFLQRQRKA